MELRRSANGNGTRPDHSKTRLAAAFRCGCLREVHDRKPTSFSVHTKHARG
ncbi:MAG: hypothetical protein IKV66_08530 [Clostridia bacterium]|nr:hypothetical protein [Clostridia bacterium]